MRKRIFLPLFCLISLLGNAQNWQGLSNYLQLPVTSLCADSNFLYAGEAYTVSNDNLVSKWNGSLWDSVGSHCTDQPRKMVIYNGQLISDACSGEIAIYDGASWQVFGQPNAKIMGIDVYGGNLYVTGYFDTISGVPCSHVAKWDGNFWTAIDTTKWNASAPATCVAIYNGDLYMGGNFLNYDGSIQYLARWDGAQWHDMAGIDFHGFGGVNCLTVYKGELYAGGLLNGVLTGGTGNGIVRWNGNRWDDMQGGVGTPPGSVDALIVFNDELIVGGNFTTNAGGIPASCIAKWDGNRWCSLGGYCDGGITSMAIYDSSLYAAGGFNIIGGDSILNIAQWVGGNYVDSCSAPDGINENNQLTEFGCYPNPVHDVIRVKMEVGFFGEIAVNIFNCLGETAMTLILKSGASEFNVDLRKLPSGIYFIQIKSTNGFRACKKVIKL